MAHQAGFSLMECIFLLKKHRPGKRLKVGGAVCGVQDASMQACLEEPKKEERERQRCSKTLHCIHCYVTVSIQTEPPARAAAKGGSEVMTSLAI